jgi:hypothetical protein
VIENSGKDGVLAPPPPSADPKRKRRIDLEQRPVEGDIDVIDCGVVIESLLFKQRCS